MIQTSKDLMCHMINHGMESITDGWYCLLLGNNKVLVELNATKTYSEFPFFWKKHTKTVPFNCAYRNDQIYLPITTHLSGIVSMTGVIDTFELRNKDHAKWCIRGSCGNDARDEGMSFSSLSAVRGATIDVNTFSMAYPGQHF